MTNLAPKLRNTLSLALLLLATSCGGGGGGGGSSAPPAPQNFVALVNGSDIEFTWDAVTGAVDYKVFVSQTASVVANNISLVGNTAATNATLSGLPSGFEFSFAVAAVRDGKQSVLSNVASATIPHQAGVDPLLVHQWHLINTGQEGGTSGEDSNVLPVWNANITGAGVRIAIVDDGLEIYHEDLAGNVVGGASHNYLGPDPFDPTGGGHGTSCAGVAGAVGNNSLGGRGAAFGADLVGYNLLAQTTSLNTVDAMTRGLASNSISSNSWGGADNLGIPQPSEASWQTAVINGVTNGRGGLGTIYTWAAGNGADTAGQVTDNSNLDGQANFWGVIAVGAVGDDGVKAWYSEDGANVLVCAPSMGRADHGITTVDRTGAAGSNDGTIVGDYVDPNYTNTFNGTSSATPLVSGVVALMLEANPNLTWRDVRLILAQTARVNDPTDLDWTQNGASYPINHKYGFGVVDAAAAVAAAQTWVNVGPFLTFTTPVRTPNLAIPDNNLTGASDQMVVAGSGIQQIEFIRVRFDADDHAATGDLAVVLRAPNGTTLSVLAEPHAQPQGSAPYDDFVFGTVRHLDEPADGTWTLFVIDAAAQDTGTFKSWRLEFYGR